MEEFVIFRIVLAVIGVSALLYMLIILERSKPKTYSKIQEYSLKDIVGVVKGDCRFKEKNRLLFCELGFDDKSRVVVIEVDEYGNILQAFIVPNEAIKELDEFIVFSIWKEVQERYNGTNTQVSYAYIKGRNREQAILEGVITDGKTIGFILSADEKWLILKNCWTNNKRKYYNKYF